MSEAMRLDAALVERGLAGGRDKAKRLILGGTVCVNGVVVRKPATPVTSADDIACSRPRRYVGRGGEKLEKILDASVLLDAAGKRCADIGASTGGFTDCLLQHGAAHVYAIDVGHDQLHSSLRADPRVTVMEGVDIRDRDAVAAIIPDRPIDICTVDVSFISLTRIWESVLPLLRGDGKFICLIKPQFEAGRAALSKKGIVRDPRDRERVLRTMLAFWKEQHACVISLTRSPIEGGDGNVEYLAVVSLQDAQPMQDEQLIEAAMAEQTI
ncbi:MAG: TlyA family RNA methyltransferase [Clostridia bacterium]|nr:TlyA family RNA methyltransferase [Clostridia bacterium]